MMLTLLLTLACTQPAYIPNEPAPVDTAYEATIPCSTYSVNQTTFTLRNESAETVRLYWRDTDCVESLYAEVVAGGSRTQEGYLAAVWVLRDLNDQLLDWFIADQPGPYDVVYP